MKRIMLTVTTATYANKAKDILSQRGISSKVKKVNGGTASGCLYGVLVDKDDFASVQALLKAEDVRVISVKEVEV